MVIAQDLDFNMARFVDKLLDEQTIVAETRARLFRREPEPQSGGSKKTNNNKQTKKQTKFQQSLFLVTFEKRNFARNQNSNLEGRRKHL